LFPAFFWALHRLGLSGKQKAFIFWSLCAIVLVWRYTLVLFFHANSDRTYLCSDTRIDSILFGCALAVWNNPVCGDGSDNPRLLRFWRYSAPLGALLLVATISVRNTLFRDTIRYTLQGIALTPIFVAAIRWPDWCVFRPLNWKPVRFIGTLSYSLYLLHQVVIAAVKDHTHLPAIARGVVALTVSLAIAWAMYVVVEAPCARLRRRLLAGT
jgi:peptidoglycan/LPS O-acetylase OafA/YrhL